MESERLPNQTKDKIMLDFLTGRRT